MRNIVFAAALLLSFSALADPQKLVDDEWVIGPGSMKGETFTLKETLPVKVIVEGMADTKKGFTVRVLPVKVWQDYKDKKITAKGLEDYIAAKGIMYKKTHKLNAGDWAVMVENSENMFKSMSVRVKIVVNPKDED
jgi:hypothetical protein